MKSEVHKEVFNLLNDLLDFKARECVRVFPFQKKSETKTFFLEQKKSKFECKQGIFETS